MIGQPIDLSGLERIRNDPGFDEVALRTFEGSLFGMVGSGGETGQVHPAPAPVAARALDRHQQDVRQ
jgi:hypothetical protein